MANEPTAHERVSESKSNHREIQRALDHNLNNKTSLNPLESKLIIVMAVVLAKRTHRAVHSAWNACAIAFAGVTLFLSADCVVGAFSPSPHRNTGGGLFRLRPYPTVQLPQIFSSGLSASAPSGSEEDPRDSPDDSVVNDGEIVEDPQNEGSLSESNEDGSDTAPKTGNAFTRLRKRLFGGEQMKLDKATMAKLGLSMVLSYGFVSNVSGCICMSVCWFVYSSKFGVSPLAPGQWPKFLAFYAGFFAFLNVIRPARFALSVALNTYFDRMIAFVQKKFDCSRGRATFLVGFFFNFCGSCAIFGAGVSIASALSGVPLWAGR